MGIFTAKRTVRDGVLIAFEGEKMTHEEAARRGLLDPAKPEPKPKRAPAKKKAPAKKAKED